MDREIIDQLVESWGAMGMLWGINRSIARVHALLILSEGPVSLDEIAQRLQMSRGNTSMSLRELRNWGVIKRVKSPGDRRDFHETEPDIWRMFFLIFAERKRREFDPALAAVRAAVRAVEASGGETTSAAVRGRLKQMEELMGTMERLLSRFLSNEKTSRHMLRFLTGWALDQS